MLKKEEILQGVGFVLVISMVSFQGSRFIFGDAVMFGPAEEVVFRFALVFFCMFHGCLVNGVVLLDRKTQKFSPHLAQGCDGKPSLDEI